MNQLVVSQPFSLVSTCDGIGAAIAIVNNKPEQATIFDASNLLYYKEQAGQLFYFEDLHENDWLESAFTCFDELPCGVRLHSLIIEILELVLGDANTPSFVRGTLVQHRECHWLKSYPVVAVDGELVTVQGFIPRFNKSELVAVGYEILPPKIKSYFMVSKQQLLELEEMEYDWAVQNGFVEVANPVPDIIKLPLKDGFGCEGGYVHTDAELSRYQASHNLLSILPVLFWPGLLAFSFAAGLFHWWFK